MARRKSVSESWEAIEQWLAANARSIGKSLRPAAPETAIDKLQSKLGLTLPATFIESLGIHDGQRSSAEHGLFPMNEPGLGPGPSCRLLPVTEIASEWAMMKELLDGGEFTRGKTRPDKGICRDWWHAGWVPVAENGGGDYYCLDLAPAKGGVSGQVIVFFHDMSERPLIARSFGAWLAELAAGLEAGRVSFSEEDGLIESPPERPRRGRQQPRTPAPLSRATQQRLDLLFAPEHRGEAATLLIQQCGNNLPFLEDATSSDLDRFRIAALKVSGGSLPGLRGAIRLAKEDWRDLLVEAGFEEDLRAHYRWQPPPRTAVGARRRRPR